MPQIQCPHCHTPFSIDENHYNHIVNQIRTQEFEHELQQVQQQIQAKYQDQLTLANEQAKSRLAEQLAKKNLELVEQQHIQQQLKDQIDQLQKSQKLITQQAIAEKEKEILVLQNQLTQAEQDKQRIRQDTEQQFQHTLNEKEKEILTLQAKEQALIAEQQYALSELSSSKQHEINQLEIKLTQQHTELKERFELELKQKEELISFYKDLKAKQSTKMIGETLEQHCEIEFNKIRTTAFPLAQFGKDNDSSSGSKGDYIYREYAEDGTEIISIMFEMKNENEQTATKKKNEHFFKELDKDRQQKNCEYAVLVSLLEADNNLYNNGIVDVSYAYPKMYVIRPQFFIPMITLLRNAALNTLQYKQELAHVRNQHIDVTHFETDLENFKTSFRRNYQLASKKFQNAISEIDKTISHLQKVKEELLSSENNLRLANNKADDISVKKLVRKNPTMKAKFDALNQSTQED